MTRITDPAILIPHAQAGDRRALARLITLVENDGAVSDEILAELFPTGGQAWTTGLTGAPGAGKSTLTDRLIQEVRSEGSEVAVVAVDPSSPFSGGAVLGDRVRMQDHIDDPGVYEIRVKASDEDGPMPTRLLIRGVVDAARQEGGESLLSLGQLARPYSAVREIRLASEGGV